MPSPLAHVPVVPVVPVGALCTAALIWRWRESCHVSVAAKATFALQQQRVMSTIVPEPIEEHELVPYRSATDVVVVAAHAFSQKPTEASAVRLVLHGATSLIDRSLLVYAPRPGGIVAPFQKAAIVKRRGLPQALVIDPEDPTTRGTFGAIDSPTTTLRDGGNGVVVVDDDVDWSRFQHAPMHQRLAKLVGDEWLMLEGMTAAGGRFQSRLPGALVETRIYSRDVWCGRSLPLVMTPCVVSIDVDNLQCSIVWRGSFTIDRAETANELTLLSAIHLPGNVTNWPSTREVAIAASLHRSRLAGLADTDRSSNATEADAERARVAARLQSLGPLAAMPVGESTQPLEESIEVSHAAADEARMVVHRQGIVMVRPNDPRELSVTDSGTLDLPPDPSELAPPAATPITLHNMPGAPWNQSDISWMQDPSKRAASGTIIADDGLQDPIIEPITAEIDEQNIDTLEQTLTDSLDNMTGDPIAELFNIGPLKRS